MTSGFEGSSLTMANSKHGSGVRLAGFLFQLHHLIPILCGALHFNLNVICKVRIKIAPTSKGYGENEALRTVPGSAPCSH